MSDRSGRLPRRERRAQLLDAAREAFVQQGYATGAAESVVGAVNVVGPLASVVFGVAVLGEGVNYTALGVALMLVSAAVSMSGVALLSRHTSAAPVSAAS